MSALGWTGTSTPTEEIKTMADELITVALPKGRMLEDSLRLFLAIGAEGVVKLRDSRRLIWDDASSGLRFLLLRAVDVPTYIEHGVADLGIAGKDILMEQGKDVYELLDLGFGFCRLVVAEPQGLQSGEDKSCSYVRVATKYPNITERHFGQKGIQVEVIKLYGSIELAPLAGLAERIVDLVSSGQTLAENGLVEVEEIMKVTARLIVNRASLKTKYSRIKGLIDRLAGEVKALRG